MSKPTIICLTPVRNEGWIIERFMKAASCWADRIIVADQNSKDGSAEIVSKFPKAVLIKNDSQSFNEPQRQKLLIDEARKIPGKRLLISLDADEVISGNWNTSVEWETILSAPKGTAFRFDWCTVLNDMQSYWIYPYPMIFGYMDDGSEHVGKRIHSPRLPVSDKSPRIHLKQIKVLHYAYTDYERNQSRQRWYQCWELLNNKKVWTLIKLYRFYHRDHNIAREHTYSIPNHWFKGYEEKGIDMTSIRQEVTYRWDKDVLDWMETHGNSFFANLNVWYLNWEKRYRTIYGQDPVFAVNDPRNKQQKRMHNYLNKTQKYFVQYAPNRPLHVKLFMRLFEKFFKPPGW